MSFSRKGIQSELLRFSRFIYDTEGKLFTCTKGAFSQARKKLNTKVFPQLNRFLLSCFEEDAPHKDSWKGYRPVAIDGSTFTLPEYESIIKRFIGCYNQTRKIIATARASIAYDVLNKLILDARIDSYPTSETVLAQQHFEHLAPNVHLLVFDRLYCSIGLILELNQKGVKYCFRLSSIWKTSLNLLSKSDDAIWHFKAGHIYRQGNNRLRLKEDLMVRVVKIRLSSGIEEILLTNLSDEFQLGDLKYLYAMRWQVEECYKRIKQITHMEYFS